MTKNNNEPVNVKRKKQSMPHKRKVLVVVSLFFVVFSLCILFFLKIYNESTVTCLSKEKVYADNLYKGKIAYKDVVSVYKKEVASQPCASDKKITASVNQLSTIERIVLYDVLMKVAYKTDNTKDAELFANKIVAESRLLSSLDKENNPRVSSTVDSAKTFLKEGELY